MDATARCSGDKPEEAYFVRCDRTTMTQNDLDNGRLICLIGVAPTKPAEFVIFRIGQWTGRRAQLTLTSEEPTDGQPCRDNPYGAFNFLVSLGGAQGDGAEGTIVGGFSDVSGLGIEVSYSEYRNGNEKVNTVRKMPEHAQERRRHAQARPDRLGRPVRVAQGACATARPTRAT